MMTKKSGMSLDMINDNAIPGDDVDRDELKRFARAEFSGNEEVTTVGDPMDPKAKATIQFPIRMNKYQHEQLKELAENNKRSLQKQIQFMLFN